MSDISNGFYCSLGKQGKGKTLFIIKCLCDELSKNLNRKVFSNITLYNGYVDKNGNREHLNYIPISFDITLEKYKTKVINSKEYEVIDILHKIKQNDDYFNDSIMILDEIHIYFDSLDFMKENNRIIHTFFSQLRKRNILLLATTQFLMNLDVRVRRQITNIFQLEKINANDGIFMVEVGEIDGTFWKPKNRQTLVLKDYYKFYNTNEIVH